MPGVAELVVRRFRMPEDIPGMAALVNARTLRDGHGDYLSPETMAELYAHPTRCDLETDVRVAERDGTVVGYARTTWGDVSEGARDHWIVVEADPTVDGLETTLLDWCEARALEVAAEVPAPPQRLVASAAVDGDRFATLSGRGFEPLRYGHMMIRPHLRDIPSGPLPDGVEIRPVTPEHWRAMFDADDVAFRDQWGSVALTEQDYLAFAEGATSGTGTSLWQVAWAGDDVIGQVRTYANDGDREMFGRRRAWTEDISTAPEWRKQGIATELICASLRQLADLGYEEAALGVDTENLSGALGLYESLGYLVVATDATMQRPITP
jgi:mycothiol synthase